MLICHWKPSNDVHCKHFFNNVLAGPTYKSINIATSHRVCSQATSVVLTSTTLHRFPVWFFKMHDFDQFVLSGTFHCLLMCCFKSCSECYEKLTSTVSIFYDFIWDTQKWHHIIKFHEATYSTGFSIEQGFHTSSQIQLGKTDGSKVFNSNIRTWKAHLWFVNFLNGW